MTTTETATPPPVHHYEEQDLSAGQRIVQWLKGQYALYILVALPVWNRRSTTPPAKSVVRSASRSSAA